MVLRMAVLRHYFELPANSTLSIDQTNVVEDDYAIRLGLACTCYHFWCRRVSAEIACKIPQNYLPVHLVVSKSNCSTKD